MKETVTIQKSVGKHGVNRSADVTTIQKRLNKWIAFGRLPGLDLLTVDGQCGKKTKAAIGAFQLLYVMGVTNPDCKCDPGGATVTHMGLDFSQGSKATPGDPVYDSWLSEYMEENVPYWEKRGMFWIGGGAKVTAGMMNQPGRDFAMLTLYNVQNPANSFQVAVSTERTMQLGGGISGGAVMCICTGIYHPNDLNGIVSDDWDFNVSLAGKWGGLAKGVAKIPYITKLVGEAKLAQYADLGTISSIITQIKAWAALDSYDWGAKFEQTMPTLTVIDTPLGIGAELSVYTGVTRYSVLHKHLT